MDYRDTRAYFLDPCNCIQEFCELKDCIVSQGHLFNEDLFSEGKQLMSMAVLVQILETLQYLLQFL